MDELELLKKDWQKQDKSYPKLSYDDIYKMILKKSSSIVKWIFIISIIEFVFWSVISIAFRDTESMENFRELHGENILAPIAIIGFGILIYFFIAFFKNYKRISVTDSAKGLMENILKTRRTVKQYVAFNIIYLIVCFIAALFIEFDKNQELNDHLSQASANGEIFKFYAIFFATVFIALVLLIGVFLLFYWLVYGILLKGLNKNYKELKKLEI